MIKRGKKENKKEKRYQRMKKLNIDKHGKAHVMYWGNQHNINEQLRITVGFFQSYGVFRIPTYIASSFRFLVSSCCHITC